MTEDTSTRTYCHEGLYLCTYSYPVINRNWLPVLGRRPARTRSTYQLLRSRRITGDGLLGSTSAQVCFCGHSMNTTNKLGTLLHIHYFMLLAKIYTTHTTHTLMHTHTRLHAHAHTHTCTHTHNIECTCKYRSHAASDGSWSIMNTSTQVWPMMKLR